MALQMGHELRNHLLYTPGLGFACIENKCAPLCLIWLQVKEGLKQHPQTLQAQTLADSVSLSTRHAQEDICLMDICLTLF